MQLLWTITLKDRLLKNSLQYWISLFAASCSILAASAETHTDTEGLQKHEIASPASAPHEDEPLTLNAKQLAEMLDIVGSIEELRAIAGRFNKDKNKVDAVDLILVRQKLSCAIQYAALELEEALANIDGELGTTNMQYSYFSLRHDHGVLMNNVATFVSSGTLGVLDSSTSIKSGAPLPNIFGITGNSLAIGIPMLGLRESKYKNPSKGERKGNMLAPIFGRTYAGSGYDPIVWTYLEAVPAQSKTKLSRRQSLLKDWQSYRQLSAEDPKSRVTVDQLIGISAHDAKISLNLLKTRSEMLLELRGQVQQMYKDISDLNTGIMAIY